MSFSCNMFAKKNKLSLGTPKEACKHMFYNCLKIVEAQSYTSLVRKFSFCIPSFCPKHHKSNEITRLPSGFQGNKKPTEKFCWDWRKPHVNNASLCNNHLSRTHTKNTRLGPDWEMRHFRVTSGTCWHWWWPLLCTLLPKQGQRHCYSALQWLETLPGIADPHS